MTTTLRRDGGHHYIYTSRHEDVLHFPPPGDSHPAYWPAPREILSEVQDILAQENKYLPRGFTSEVSTDHEGLCARVQGLLIEQAARQRAAAEEEADALLEEELDRLGY